MRSAAYEALLRIEEAMDDYLGADEDCGARRHLEMALAATGELQRALIEARLAYRDGWGNEARKSTSSATIT